MGRLARWLACMWRRWFTPSPKWEPPRPRWLRVEFYGREGASIIPNCRAVVLGAVAVIERDGASLKPPPRTRYALVFDQDTGELLAHTGKCDGRAALRITVDG